MVNGLVVPSSLTQTFIVSPPQVEKPDQNFRHLFYADHDEVSETISEITFPMSPFGKRLYFWYINDRKWSYSMFATPSIMIFGMGGPGGSVESYQKSVLWSRIGSKSRCYRPRLRFSSQNRWFWVHVIFTFLFWGHMRFRRFKKIIISPTQKFDYPLQNLCSDGFTLPSKSAMEGEL